jgi:hypothetical protein
MASALAANSSLVAALRAASMSPRWWYARPMADLLRSTP